MHIQDNDTQRNLSTVSEPSEMKQNLTDHCTIRTDLLQQRMNDVPLIINVT